MNGQASVPLLYLRSVAGFSRVLLAPAAQEGCGGLREKLEKDELLVADGELAAAVFLERGVGRILIACRVEECLLRQSGDERAEVGADGFRRIAELTPYEANEGRRAF